MSRSPSYVGWLTCLEINSNARTPAANVGAQGGAGAETSAEVTPKERRRQH
jgi:hypothetical protein